MRNKTGREWRGWTVLGIGAALIAGSAFWLFMSGDTGLRYTADHNGTVPMWERWIPSIVGIVLVRLMPIGAPVPPVGAPADVREQRGLRLEAWILLMAAVLFAVTLRLAGGGEPAHTLLKLPLLLGVPAALFWILRRRGDAWTPAPAETGPWRRYAPAVPVAAWLVVGYASPLALPPSDYARTVDPLMLVSTVVVVFLVNSLLEEVFYRRWLQTRWEAVLGPWPGIVLASLLWAAWHIGIQGSGELGTDLASAFVNQGVQGLFLGYLWSRYRMMWPLLVVHGAVNAVPILAGLW